MGYNLQARISTKPVKGGFNVECMRAVLDLNISRGSIYYQPRPVCAADLAIMRQMDELHLVYPVAGSRMLRDLLNSEGLGIGRLHVATLMKRMGIEAFYRKPNTSKPKPGHKIYPHQALNMRPPVPETV